MYARLRTRAIVQAGAYTGLLLYALCPAFYLVVYGGTSERMIQPFMPGVTNTASGYLLGFVWAAFYGAGIPWLLAVFYNRALPAESVDGPTPT